jgi:hypothetical protein
MYPDLELARTRIAELHHQALLDTVAIAMGRARRANGDRSRPAVPGPPARAVCRALALLFPRSA